MRLFWIAIPAAILAVGSAARADDTDRADALFKEGRDLLEHGKVNEACAKFEAALQLNSESLGALLNAAACDEKRGHVASAYARFTKLRDIAKVHQEDRILAEAQKKLTELALLVPHVTITISLMLPGMKLVIDDKAVSLEDKAIPVEGASVDKLPIDPGEHTVAVSAPNRLPYHFKFSIVQTEVKTIAIPVLSSPVKSYRKTIAVITGTSGIAALAAGIGIGLYAKNKYQAQFDNGNCRKIEKMTSQCNMAGQSAVDSARVFGDVGTALGIAGVAAIGVGAFLFFTAPKQPTETRLAVMPQVAPDQIGVVAVGSF